MTGSDQQQGRTWHARFYLTCAVSATLIGLVIFTSAPRTWESGFAVGYGAAGVHACILLAAKSFKDRRIAQEDRS